MSNAHVHYIEEIAEDVSSVHLQQKFATIRGSLRVGTVNLIYRHLATIPPLLDFAAEVAERARESTIIRDCEKVLSEITSKVVPPAQFRISSGNEVEEA